MKESDEIMRNLERPYLQVETKTGNFYGGNQEWFSYKFLKQMGCGVISAADVLLHLCGKESVSEEEYVDFAKELWMKYLPVVPGFGMNGLTLMIGMNRYFSKHRMPYRACWKISAEKMFSRIDTMLSKDLPVILAIGPNFPKIWKKEKLNFYMKTSEGNYVSASKICAHFVTVTGREEAYLKISSWGKEYYISIREYRDYVKKYSSSLVSNIIYLRRIASF